jgi:hypothetical protein
MRFLDEVEVHTTISLDGRKASNDKLRVYFREKDRSVFDDVIAKIKDLPKGNLGVSLVFTHETIDDFLGNVLGGAALFVLFLCHLDACGLPSRPVAGDERPQRER